MAKTCLIVKAKRPAKFSTRAYTRCQICGRSRAVYKKFMLCRLCFRGMANNAELPGVRKSSW